VETTLSAAAAPKSRAVQRDGSESVKQHKKQHFAMGLTRRAANIYAGPILMLPRARRIILVKRKMNTLTTRSQHNGNANDVVLHVIYLELQIKAATAFKGSCK
jgi:hypothetical protein